MYHSGIKQKARYPQGTKGCAVIKRMKNRDSGKDGTETLGQIFLRKRRK